MLRSLSSRTIVHSFSLFDIIILPYSPVPKVSYLTQPPYTHLSLPSPPQPSIALHKQHPQSSSPATMSSSSDNRQASAIKGGTGTTPTPANTDTSGRRRVRPSSPPSPIFKHNHHVLNPRRFSLPSLPFTPLSIPPTPSIDPT